MTGQRPMDADRFRRIVALTDRVVAEGVSALADADPADVSEVEGLLRSSTLPEPKLAMRSAIGDVLDRIVADDRARAVKPAFAGYEIGRLLGSGGHADVWEATEAGGRHRRVAIKVLTSSRLARRFRLEREVVGRLAHPGIAAILAEGTTLDGRPCMVMELVEGLPFAEACVRHALTVRRRVELVVEVCRAVDHAHAHGIIHRDLKPANILVGYRPVDGDAEGPMGDGLRLCAKVIDFGVAKALAHAGAGTVHERETLPGQLVGTLAYMSPEQRRGTTGLVTLAVDVYALGTVLYESLAGRHRWDLNGLSIVQGLDAMASIDPMPLGDAAPHLPRDLVAIVEKAIAERPEDRYASMRAFGDDLERWLAGAPVSARSPGIGRRALWILRRHPRAATVVAAAAALGALGVALAAHRTLEQRRLGVELANWCETSIDLINDVASTPGSLEGRDRLSAFVTGQIDHLVELVNATGGIPKSRLDDIVAESAIARSVVLRQKGEIDEAGVLRRKAMAVREAALEREPSDLARRELAYAVILVGDIHRERGDELGALALYESAHAIYRDLVARAGPDAIDDRVQLLWSHDRLCDVALSQAGLATVGGDEAMRAARLREAIEHADAMASLLAVLHASPIARAAAEGSGTSAPTLARLLHAEVAMRSRVLATAPADLPTDERAAMHERMVARAEELCAVAPSNVVFLQQLTGCLGAAASFEWTRGDLGAAMRYHERQLTALRQALDREPGDLDTRCRLAECFAALASMSISARLYEDAERWIALGRDSATLLVR